MSDAPSPRWSRRDFARCALCVATVPAVARAFAGTQPAGPLVVDLADPDYAPLRHVGGAVKVTVPDRKYPVLVVRIDEDQIIAYSSACTHWDCEVELPDERGRVECHCHGSEFDIEGRYVDGPAEGDLERIPVNVVQPTAVEARSWAQMKTQRLETARRRTP